MGLSSFGNENAALEIQRVILPVTGSSTPSEFLTGPLQAPYQLFNPQGVAQLVGSTSCAFNIGKVTGSQPVGSATPLLAATVNMVSSADIVITGSQIGSQALQQLAVGDRLVLMKTGYWPTTMIAGVSCLLRRY